MNLVSGVWAMGKETLASLPGIALRVTMTKEGDKKIR